MSPLHDSKDLVPFDAFNARASEMIRRLRRRNRPFLITRNGRVVAALLSLAQFDRMVGETKLIGAVREGLDVSQAGRVIPDDRLDSEDRSARR